MLGPAGIGDTLQARLRRYYIAQASPRDTTKTRVVDTAISTEMSYLQIPSDKG
jgi:hypothetical protein